MKLTDLGKVGRLEAMRQALEDAAPNGLTGRQLIEAAGLTYKTNSGGYLQSVLCPLTEYCFIYESDHGQQKYFLDVEGDATFNRRIFVDSPFKDDDKENGNA